MESAKLWNFNGNFKQYCSNTHVQLLSANGPYTKYLNEPAINEQGTRQNKTLWSTIIMFFKDIDITKTLDSSCIDLCYTRSSSKTSAIPRMELFVTIAFATTFFFIRTIYRNIEGEIPSKIRTIYDQTKAGIMPSMFCFVFLKNPVVENIQFLLYLLSKTISFIFAFQGHQKCVFKASGKTKTPSAQHLH